LGRKRVKYCGEHSRQREREEQTNRAADRA
jgi:hypothetical protein